MTRSDKQPGTYALILHSCMEQRVQIGKLGELDVTPGFYVYVGSAFGPGGLTARVTRHRQKTKKLRWHIDYLTAVMSVEQVWNTLDADRRECQWAEVLGKMRGAYMPLARFGASDCACRTHLWSFPIRPSRRGFRRRLLDSSPIHGPVRCMDLTLDSCA
jgi:Uri superfamily endonuclease